MDHSQSSIPTLGLIEFLNVFQQVKGQSLNETLVKEIKKQIFALDDTREYLGLGHLRRLISILEPEDKDVVNSVLRGITSPEELNKSQLKAKLVNILKNGNEVFMLASPEIETAEQFFEAAMYDSRSQTESSLFASMGLSRSNVNQ